MSVKSRGGGGEVVSKSLISKKWTLLLCISSFCAGVFFTNRMWTVPESKGITITPSSETEGLKLISEGCGTKYLQPKDVKVSKDVFGEVSKTHHAIQTLDKTISNLEMELAAAKAAQESILNGSPMSEDGEKSGSSKRRKYFMVIGINTAFSSRKRRDSVRTTWMPQGEKRKKLEEEKGVVIRFVIGHGATVGGILDRAIDAEDKKHGDFLRLDHVEGYLELSAKTKTYFSTAVKLWDAEYYIKVDDDVHVNIGTLGETLARHRKKPRVYIGCMKSGPVLSQKHVLHKYANEDVSLGAWFIGLDVHHVDDRRLCCGTPPDCEWKAQAGNICVASFDWTCSGICRSADRIKEVHRRCGEGEKVLWNAAF
nr:probable beta-1,3-galactosyltransferase 2 isoform X1 [Ipomoea batatas]